MSVADTPEDQYLEPSLQQIVDGIRDFSAAVEKRLAAGAKEWTPEHLEEISKLRLKLIKLEPELYKLKGSVR